MHRIKRKMFTWKKVGKRPSGAYCRKVEAEFLKMMGAVPFKYEKSTLLPSTIAIDNDFDDIPVLEDIDTSVHGDNNGVFKTFRYFLLCLPLLLQLILLIHTQNQTQMPTLITNIIAVK